MAKRKHPRVRFPKRNKFNANPTTYRGWRFDSKAEAEFAKKLDSMVGARLVLWWLRQVPIDLTEDDRYRVDFVVCYTDGILEAIEVKGMETEAFRRIRRLWLKYGPFPLKIVKKNRTTETLWDGETTAIE
ncbi:MAG: hypothetical protein Tp1124DCM412911_37 [Prokaryotic dsDNA virus sp.]|nr:MAG: hypothetical protein Tp1124DCM412911_37 [Prokaryotic dsDNA virus sp.]|tara:strand:+ start:1060 stop:1449 length:390 start_codon:yes stop_codon:yes gene_type:complete